MESNHNKMAKIWVYYNVDRKTEIFVMDKQIGFFMKKKGYFQLFVIWTLLFKYSNNIWS